MDEVFCREVQVPVTRSYSSPLPPVVGSVECYYFEWKTPWLNTAESIERSASGGVIKTSAALLSLERKTEEM